MRGSARWRAVLGALGLGAGSDQPGPTPGAMRGSGATLYYMSTEDLPRTMWRGRWRSTTSAERYLQEATAQAFLSSLPSAVRSRVALFARTSGGVLKAYLDGCLHGSDEPPVFAGGMPSSRLQAR